MSSHRYISGQRPLADVLARAFYDFMPETPGRRPWHQPTLEQVHYAVSDNRAVVSLRVADRARLQGLEAPTGEQDFLEPADWMKVGWTAA